MKSDETGDVAWGRGAMIAATALIVVAAVALAAFAIPTLRLSNDAGYYLPLARLTAGGLTPIRDFPTAYAPGSYYLLAPLGVERLMDPAWTKACLFGLHALNGILLAVVLRRIGRTRAESWFWSAVFCAWVLASDGFELELEPFVNAFVLASLAVLVRSHERRGTALAAGALAGGALMMKQYAVVLVAMLFVAAVLRDRVVTGAAPDRSARVRRALMFTAGVPLAFVLFVALTRQDLVASFVQFVTGGRFGSAYAATGLRGIWSELSRGRALVTVIPAGAMTMGLVALAPTARNLLTLCAFLVALLPLYARQYPHYVQLAAPWGVMAMAGLADEIGSRLRASPGAKCVLALIVAAPFVAPFVSCATLTAKRIAAHEVRIDEDCVRALLPVLPQRDDVLVVNHAQIYAMADITPPRRDYRFLFDLDTPGELELADAARFAVVDLSVATGPEFVKKLTARGFEHQATAGRLEVLRHAR